MSLIALLALPAAAQQNRVDFMGQVHPILAQKCFACHGGDKRSGGLSVQEYDDVLKGGRSGPAVIPGDSKQSLIVLRVTGAHAPQMPLAGPKLTPEEVATLRLWIDQGARATQT
ncbi:MAG: c-type cytochrome domain-containing protein, partial [Bryobacteraceae bacterium]